MRARPIAVTDELRARGEWPSADYVDACQAHIDPVAARSAERWARDALQGMPRPLRIVVLLGWRVVLGLRLGPLDAADHVMGWRMRSPSAAETRLDTRSWLMQAQLLFCADESAVTWMTFVRHENLLSRVIWMPVGFLHRRIVPYALTRAARRSAR